MKAVTAIYLGHEEPSVHIKDNNFVVEIMIHLNLEGIADKTSVKVDYMQVLPGAHDPDLVTRITHSLRRQFFLRAAEITVVGISAEAELQIVNKVSVQILDRFRRIVEIIK